MSENNENKPIRKTWIMLKRAYNGIALNSLPIGTLVKDTNSTFLGTPIIWKVADINHEGYPKNSITLISDKVLALRPFDAAEKGGKWYGNNRYAISNIRQWLNSNATAGQWYSAQHSNDYPPSRTYVDYNAYAEDTGFLNQFSIEFQNALIPTELIVPLYKVSDNGYDTIIDKMFLASATEVGLGNSFNCSDGHLLAAFTTANNSRYTYPTVEAYNDSELKSGYIELNKVTRWWVRTPPANSDSSLMIGTDGKRDSRTSDAEFGGIRPLCNLSSTIRVSETPDENGVYTIVQF